MNITIRQFTLEDKNVWDAFVISSVNGTIFHLRSFLSYHIERQFEDHSLIIEKKGKIIAVFPAAKIIKGGKNILYSHPGASFGGFVYHDLSYKDADIMVKSLNNYCSNNNTPFCSLFI